MNEKNISKLEKEFIEIVERARSEIKIKLKDAMKALDEAVEISNKYGIPFKTNISPLPNIFIPKSFTLPLNIDKDLY